jgi:hypothetical protein
MLLLIVGFIVVLIVIIVIYKKMTRTPVKWTPHKVFSGKTIWLLWYQGWDHAPWLVQQVRKSWELHNPTWNIVLLDQSNLSQYIDHAIINNNAKLPAKSDLIRLNLLAEYGGVWADATMLCMVSLDRWIYDALQPVGFWMYHGRDNGAGPASWFIISQRQSYIIQRWREAANKFWQKTRFFYDYAWMDALFKDLLDKDTRFREEWAKVPYIWADAPYQSHMLAEIVSSWNPELHADLQNNPPYAIKLSHHKFPADYAKTNAFVAIQAALSGTEFPLHKMQQRMPLQIFTSDKVLVCPDCGDKAGVEFLAEICASYGMQLIVYDKCDFCAAAPIDIYCRPLSNVGRDMGTYVYFVMTYYDHLPNEIIFCPSNITKHKRKQRLEQLLKQSSNNGCAKIPLGKYGDFTLDEYEGIKQTTALTRPLKTWYSTYIANYNHDMNKPGFCMNGMMRTFRSNIHKHPRQLYYNLHEQLKVANSPEVGHYIERIMQLIF